MRECLVWKIVSVGEEEEEQEEEEEEEGEGEEKEKEEEEEEEEEEEKEEEEGVPTAIHTQFFGSPKCDHTHPYLWCSIGDDRGVGHRTEHGVEHHKHAHDPRVAVLVAALSLQQLLQHCSDQLEGKGRHQAGDVGKGDGNDLLLAPEREEKVGYFLDERGREGGKKEGRDDVMV